MLVQSCTQLFSDTLYAKDRVIVLRGGTRSGKTIAICQALCHILETEQDKRIGIFRKTFPALRISVMRDVVDMLKDRGTYRMMKHHLGESTIYNPISGSEIIFSSVDDPQKFRGPEWNYVWLNEANEFDYEDYLQFSFRMSRKSVDRKPNRIFLDFNPDDDQVWIKTKLEDAGRCKVFVSTYKDNPFLDVTTRAEIEYLEKTDPNFWNVYGLGQYGTRTKGLIYNGWEVASGADEKSGIEFEEEIFGVDFGFNNPAAIVGIKKVVGKKRLHVREVLYQSHLTNSDLILAMRSVDVPSSAQIYADSAEPARIEEIIRAGWLSTYPAAKNVKLGIDFCQRFEVALVGIASNILREAKTYKWREDRYGELLDEPVKFSDHALDAFRYAVFTHGRDYWIEESERVLSLGSAKSSRPRSAVSTLFKGY